MKHIFFEGRTPAKITVSYKKKNPNPGTHVIAVSHMSEFLLNSYFYFQTNGGGKLWLCLCAQWWGPARRQQFGRASAPAAFWRGCFRPGPAWAHGVTSCGGWGLGGACLYCELELGMVQGIAFLCSKPTKRDKGRAGKSGNLLQKRTPKETRSL